MSLRERKKTQTRERLIEVALELFERHGYEATTVEQIAAAAEVAPRTLFRYFTSKDDLIFLGQDAETALLGDLLKKRPPGEAPLDSLLHCARVLLRAMLPTWALAQRSMQLVLRTPSLRARNFQLLDDVQQLLVAGLLPKRATRREALRLQLLVAAYLASLRVLINAWILNGSRGDLLKELDLLEQTLRHGFA